MVSGQQTQQLQALTDLTGQLRDVHAVRRSDHLALARGQPGLGVSDPEVHLPHQQHVLLLLRVPHCDDRLREIHRCLSSNHLQTNVNFKLKQAKVNF